MTFDEITAGIDKSSEEYKKYYDVYMLAKKEDLDLINEACEQTEKKLERCKAYKKWLKLLAGDKICEACNKYKGGQCNSFICTRARYKFFVLNMEVLNDTGAVVSI